MKRLLLLFSIVSCWVTAVGQCPPAGPLSSPYFEDFSTINNGATGSSFNNCWVATTTADPNWESEKSGTANSSTTGPDYDNSYGFGTNGYYVYLETSSGSQGDTGGFYSPAISLTGLTSPELSFYYHMYGANIGELEVQIWNGTQWDSVWAIVGQQQTSATEAWRAAKVDLSSYTGNIQVKFLGSKGGTSYTGDMAIDDIRIDEATSCTDSIGLVTINSEAAFEADVIWSGNTGATSWQIHYVENGNDFYTGTTITSSSDSTRLTGLNSDTEYRVYVRQACSGSGYGPWTAANRLQTLVSCPAPSGFTVNSTTTTAADLSWTTGGATSWIIEYDTVGFTPGQGTAVVANSNTNYSLSGLTAGSRYDVYVRDFCMAGDSSVWVGPITVYTSCNAITAPYFTGFESDVAGLDPLCWSSYASNGAAFVRVDDYTGTAAPYTGSHALYMYSGSSSTTPGADTLIAISPQFSDLTAGDKQIRFFANSDAPADSLIIGTMNTPSTMGTFTPLDTIYFPTADTYQEVILQITTANGYNGTDQYIALVHNLGVTTDYIRIDDFTYEQIPSCTKVTNINLDAVGALNATFSFTANGNTFDYEWGPTGYTFGQGTATTGTATGNPMTVSGFQPSTTYDIYIRNNCTGSGNGTSVWEGPFTFTTLCYFVAPFNEDFETYTASQYGPNISGCFSATRTSNPRWETEDATGANENSVDTGPWTDGSGNTSGMYLYLECSGGSQGDADSIITPIINVSALTSPYIKFDYHMYGQTMGDLEVYYEDNGTWYNAITISGQVQTSGAEPWATAYAAAPATGDSIRIKIKGIRGSNYYSDMSIDNFGVIEEPACIPSSFVTMPSDSITTSSAYISWTPGTGTSFVVEWGPTGFIPGISAGSGTMTVTNAYASISGLSPNTTYDFYVTDDCGSAQAIPAGPATITTLCSPTSMPYYESFDTWPLTCWTQTGGQTFIEYTGTSSSHAWANGTGISELNSGAVSITQDAQVRFKWSHYYASFYADELEIRAKVVGGAWQSIFVINGSDFNDAGAGYTSPGNFTEEAILLDPAIFTGHDVIVQIKATSAYPDIFIEDFYIENAPACPDPFGLTATHLVDTSAVLDWGVSPSYQSSQVWFGPQGFFQGSQTLPGQGVQVITANDTLLIDTLSPNTCYEYGIRGICGPGDTTDWVGPFTFCTPCSPDAMPYTESFDNFPFPCWDNELGTYHWQQQIGSGGDNYGEANFWNVSAGNEILMRSNTIGITQDAWLKFQWSHQYNSSYPNDELVVRAQVVSTGAWDTLFQISAAAFDAPGATYNTPGTFIQEYIILPTSYTGEDVHFELLGVSGWGPDAFVNDFIIEAVPSCLFPSNLSASNATTTTVDLAWTTGGASNWQVEYGPTGFTPGQGTKVPANANPFTVTSLSPGVVYDFYVRDSCGVGDVSLPTGPATIQTPCVSTLSGSYTIGAAGGYATLDSIVDALNLCGVSGAVTVNLGGGTHNAITLTNIPGASATNTVTFMGSANFGDTIDGAGGSWAVNLDNAEYITFDGVYITNTTGSNFVVWLHNSANEIEFDNCYLEGSRTSTSSLSAVVVGTGLSTTAYNYDDNVNNLTVTNSTIAGGYLGITINGSSSTTHSSGMNISNNTFEDQYYYGIRAYYMDSVELHNNYVGAFRNTFSYGLYCYYNDILNVTGNTVEDAGTYGMYAYYTNRYLTGAPSTAGLVANNMMNGGTAGIYCYSPNYVNFYHNTLTGSGTYGGMYLSGSTTAGYQDINVRNNIFYQEASNYAFALYAVPTGTFTLNHNVYYSTGTNLAYHLAAQTDLAAWQTAQPSYNANSVVGDPLFFSPTDLHVLGGVANDVGDNTVGITVDIDGDARPATGSTIVDIGADEYTPVAGDLGLFAGKFAKEWPCYSTADTIELMVYNVIGTSVDFATNPLVATFNVTGPVNTTGTITQNTGTLAAGDTIVLRDWTIDMSIPGTYTLNAYIDSNAVNSLAFNDTLDVNTVTMDVDSILTVTPKSHTFTGANDTLEIKANSPFFGGGDFHFTEIMHFKTSTGAPASWPAWHVSDEHVEITGVPGADLAGYTFEQWNTSGNSPSGSITFPSGTVLGPNGTAVFSMRAATPSPSDYYYDGSGGNTTDWQSSGGQGVILKDPSGNIVDAAAYPSSAGSYTFPTAANVSAAQYGGGNIGGATSTCGVRLEGPDMNDATNWIVVSSSNPQDPNTVNGGVIVPAPVSVTGFTWSLNGVVTTTGAVDTVAANQLSAGTHWYVATFNSPCGVYTDSVMVVVPSCLPPSGLSGSALSTSSVQLSWDTAGVGATNYEVQYGPAGFTPGTGTSVSATGTSATVSNVGINLCQEYYVRAACSPTDNSPWAGPIVLCPQTTICTDDLEQYATGYIGGQSVLFLPWGGNGGDGDVSTTQANSGSQSLFITDGGTNGFSDIVAYFDTIDNGAWDISFSLYVNSGSGAYYNIQQNHVLPGGTGSNQWSGHVYFDGAGTATVQYGSNVTAGTFSYTQGQWIDINTVIDLAQDTIWVEYNGNSTGIGWAYSMSNAGAPLQFNGVNFYSGVITGGTYGIDYYMDDFCVSPHVYQGCVAPTGLAVSNEGCDSVEVSWTSLTGASSIIEYGPAGFTPGTGTFLSYVTSSTVVSGLTPGTSYDFYVADTCSNDTSTYTGPVNVTTLNGPKPHASFTYTVNGFVVNVDASGSTNGDTYSWDYGDSNTGSGVMDSNTYASGGAFNITLTVSNACGSDDTTITVTDVSISENELARSLVVYPNPAKDVVNIKFNSVSASDDVIIRMLDVSGKEVKAFERVADQAMFEQSINIGELPKGVYMLEISNGGFKVNKRLVKN